MWCWLAALKNDDGRVWVFSALGKSSFQGLMKKVPLFKNWVFRYSRFGFIWGALVPEVSKLGAALGVLTPYIQSPYFGDWIYRYARSWFYLLDSRLRGPCETAAGSSAEVSLQRFPCSGRGPYFVRTESTDVPGYGFICKALVNTLLLAMPVFLFCSSKCRELHFYSLLSLCARIWGWGVNLILAMPVFWHHFIPPPLPDPLPDRGRCYRI